MSLFSKIVLNIFFVVGLFGMFVPYEYLSIPFAIPVSIVFFLLCVGAFFTYSDLEKGKK